MFETAIYDAVEKTINHMWKWTTENHPDWMYEKNGESWMKVSLDGFNKSFKYIKKDSNGLDMETLSEYIEEMKDRGLLVANLVKGNWWVSLVSQDSAPAPRDKVSPVASDEGTPITGTKKRKWAEIKYAFRDWVLDTNAEWWWGLKVNEDGSKSLWDGSRTFNTIGQYNAYRKYFECSPQVLAMTKKAISIKDPDFHYTEGAMLTQEEWRIWVENGSPTYLI